MATISIENVRKNYGAVEVIKGVSFEVADGNLPFWSVPADAENRRSCA